MKKYIYIFKPELMSSMQYKFDILASFFGYFIHIFVFLNLWKYIYTSPDELISGYDMNQMIWYVIVTEYLWSLVGGRSQCKKISDDVKSGNISYNISKPYSYINYALTSHLGSITVKGIIYAFLGLLVGYIFLGKFPNLSVSTIILTIISSLLATIVSTLFITFIGLFSFYIEDSTPFYWVYSKFTLIFGTIFPVEIFPKTVRNIISHSPVYAATYGPAKLFVDFSKEKLIEVFTIQIIYVLIAYLLCLLIYKRGVRKLNVNGG